MISLGVYTSPPHPCGYLKDRTATMQYEAVLAAEPADYEKRLLRGWRRFGRSFFRPTCEDCRECRSIRIPTETFAPDRSQRRAVKANQDVTLVINRPTVDEEKLAIYDRYHQFQAEHRGWPEHGPKDAAEYQMSFVENPIPTEEWCYYLNDRLIAVGIVDVVPAGLSAIYFYYDPDYRDRSLGTFNVMQILAVALERRFPHVYLGYYVADCPSVSYKVRFRPNEVLTGGNRWRPFRT